MEIAGGICCLGITSANAYIYNEVRKNLKDLDQDEEIHKEDIKKEEIQIDLKALKNENDDQTNQNNPDNNPKPKNWLKKSKDGLKKFNLSTKSKSRSNIHQKHAETQTEMFLEEFRKSNSCINDKFCGLVRNYQREDTSRQSESSVLKSPTKRQVAELPSLDPVTSNFVKVDSNNSSFRKSNSKRSNISKTESQKSDFNKPSNYDNHLLRNDSFDLEHDDLRIVSKSSSIEHQASSIAARMRQHSPEPIGLKGTLLNNGYEQTIPTSLIHRSKTPIVSVSESESDKSDVVFKNENYENSKYENASMDNHRVLGLTPSLMEARKQIHEGLNTDTVRSDIPSEVQDLSTIDAVSLDQTPVPSEADLFFRKNDDFGPTLDSKLQKKLKLLP